MTYLIFIKNGLPMRWSDRTANMVMFSVGTYCRWFFQIGVAPTTEKRTTTRKNNFRTNHGMENTFIGKLNFGTNI